VADDGHLAGNLCAHFGGEKCQGIPGKQITAKTESHRQEQQQHAAQPSQLSRLAVRAQEHDAEHVSEGTENHQVGGPGMNRAPQPAELHARHDVLHAFESLVGSWPVIKQQQNSRANLDHEQKEGDSSEKIPVRELVDGNGLFFQRLDQLRPVEAFI
jgi:hypothetical protein